MHISGYKSQKIREKLPKLDNILRGMVWHKRGKIALQIEGIQEYMQIYKNFMRKNGCPT